MTKFEWERQLKKGISGLPKTEQQRVLDYYNELFADKIDAGLREQYIISEFGNPYDVANKILVDYYNDGKENPEVDAYIYSSSDEIDEAFDEEPAPATVAAPKRKTWTERREERHYEQNVRHAERAKEHYDVEDANSEQTDKKSKKGAASATGLIVILSVLIYCVLGACFRMWHPAWIIFLVIPCIITLIEAIRKRNWKIFAYPVFVTALFLWIGCAHRIWHPTWILFITIPLYYVLGEFIERNINGGKKSKANNDSKPNYDDEQAVQPERVDQTRTNKSNKRVKSESATNVFAVIAKVLMTICFVWVSIVVWSFVIGLFCGGIGLIVGGVFSFIAAFTAGIDALALGLGLAQFGLGIICVFGMAALFKPCFNMCKTLFRTVKTSFAGKENA